MGHAVVDGVGEFMKPEAQGGLPGTVRTSGRLTQFLIGVVPQALGPC